MYQIILLVILFLIVIYLLYQNYTIQKEIYKIKNSFDELNNFLDLSIKKTKPKVLDTLSSINTTDITDNVITYSNDVKRVKVETTINSEDKIKEDDNSNFQIINNNQLLNENNLDQLNQGFVESNSDDEIEDGEQMEEEEMDEEEMDEEEIDEEDEEMDENEIIGTDNEDNDKTIVPLVTQETELETENTSESRIEDVNKLVNNIKNSINNEIKETETNKQNETKNDIETNDTKQSEEKKDITKTEEININLNNNQSPKETYTKEVLQKRRINSIKQIAKKFNIVLSVNGKAKSKDDLIRDIVSKNI